MIHCRYCKKDIPDKSSAYKIGKLTYYCSEECYNKAESKRVKNKSKYEPVKNTDRRECTDYIQQIYLDEGYDKREINWTLLMSQVKNMIDQNGYKYTGITLTLHYMIDIKGINLFSSNEFNGSILNLVPFYYEEAKQNYIQTREIKENINNFEFNETPIIIHKSNSPTIKYKKIDIGGLR